MAEKTKSVDEDEQKNLVEVEAASSEALGLVFSAGGEVKEVSKESPAAGKVLVGDKVNEEKLKEGDEVEKLVQKFLPKLSLRLVRGLKASQEKIPEAREKNITRQEGFTYHIAKIDFIKGCKFGMGIKHFQNKVLVSRVDEGSLSAKCLKTGDHIIDVNGSPVTDKDVARNMLLKALQRDRTVSLLIGRAQSQQAVDKIMFAMTQSENQPPSVAMASDIQKIIIKQKEKMKDKIEPKKGVLRRMDSAGAERRKVKVVAENPNVMVIASDNEGKQLKPVRTETSKPQGSKQGKVDSKMGK